MPDSLRDTEDFAKRLGFGKSCEEEPCGDPNCPALKKHDCVGGEYVPVATFSDNPLAYEQARIHRVLEFRDYLAHQVGRTGLGDMYDVVIDGLDRALDGEDD